ncbi:MAG: hypothetical protein HZB16_00960 [Armatimonadetes bacterium]|nr:hypothetical protein [Armatimonadota bacterium]
MAHWPSLIPLRLCALALATSPLLAAGGVQLGPQAPQAAKTVSWAGLHAEVVADDIITHWGRRRVIELNGSAKVTAKDLVVQAQHIELDLTDDKHATVRGRGAVRVVRTTVAAGADRYATGEEVVVDIDTLTGYVTDALISQPLPFQPKPRDLLDPDERPRVVNVSAKRAALNQPVDPGTKILPNRWVDLQEPSIWIPQGKTPQFRLRAARAQMLLCEPGCLVSNVDVLKMRDVRLQLGGHTVLRLPELHLGTGGLYLPYLGYNSTWGVFAQQSLSIKISDNVKLRATPRLGTVQGITGTTSLEYTTGMGRLALATTFRERTTLPVSRETVQYSRWPEASWTLPVWTVPKLGGDLKASAAVGIIREHGTGTFWRSRYDLGWAKAIHQGPTFAASLRSGAHWSYGEGGYMYGWVGGGATIEKNFAERFWIKLGADSRWVSGKTPYRFERLEAPITLTADARWRVARHWVLEDALGYDVERGRVIDHSTSILYRDRLLEYGVTVRSEPELEFQLAAGVVGF